MNLLRINLLTPPICQQFRKILANNGYTERAYKELQVYSFFKTFSENVIIPEKLKNAPETDFLFKLFYLGRKIKNKEAEQLFKKDLLRNLIDANILYCLNNGFLSSRVMILPYSTYYFTSDFIYRYDGPASRSKKNNYHNIVYPASADTIDLWEAAVKKRAKNTLDLCTGCGALAILASTFSKKVVGIDINPRAINLAQFNALFNNIKNVEFKCGDLFEPIDANSVFYLILVNPPYLVKSPETTLYSDGGVTGDALLKKVVGGVPKYLKKEGYCQIVSAFFSTNKQRNIYTLLHKWLNNRSFNIFFLKLRMLDLYQYVVSLSLSFLRNDHSVYAKQIKTLLSLLRTRKISSISYGIINLRLSQSSREKELFVKKTSSIQLEKYVRNYFNDYDS